MKPGRVMLPGGYAAAGGGLLTVDAVVFDGTNDYLTRGADYTGSADSDSFIFSCWVKFNGGDAGTQYFVVADAGDGYYIRRNTSNKVNISMQNSSSTTLVNIASGTSVVVADGWVHILIAKTGTTFYMYINDAADSPTVTTNSAGNTDYTKTTHSMGALNTGTSKINADVAELYWAPGQYLDISNAANRAKFISGGKPVDMGSDGSTPTGTAPILYLSVRPGDAASDFVTNRGSGGGMTLTGTLAIAATSPSD